jgi:hypothetical protein
MIEEKWIEFPDMPYPFELEPEANLAIIRQIDCFHPWKSLAEKRRCRRCGTLFTGEQIEIAGGRGSTPLRLQCPTDGCCSVPIEWMMPPAAAEDANKLSYSECELPPMRDESSPASATFPLSPRSASNGVAVARAPQPHGGRGNSARKMCKRLGARLTTSVGRTPA